MVFAHVVEQGGFSAAAREMGLSRAAISHQIRQLEAKLGVPLLRRSTRNFSLTDAGARYYDSCRTISLEAEAARKRVEALRDDPVGKVSLTCSIHLGTTRIVPLLSRFRQEFPDVSVDIKLSDNVVDVIGQGIDIAIRSGPLRDSELKAVKLFRASRLIVASKAYIDQHGRPETPADLGRYDWVLYRQVPENLILQSGDEIQKVRVSGKVRVDNAAARLCFLHDGHGLAIVPRYDVQEHLKSGKLAHILPDWTLPDLEVFAVFPADVTRSSKVKALLDYFRRHLALIDESRQTAIANISHVDQ